MSSFSLISRMSVTTKATLAALVLTLMVFTAVAVLHVRLLSSKLADAAEAKAATETELLASAISGAVRWGKPEVAAKTLDPYFTDPESTMLAAVSLGLDGAIVTEHGATEVLGPLPDPAAVSSSSIQRHGSTRLRAVAPTALNPDGSAQGVLVVAWSLAQVNAQIAADVRQEAMISIALALLSAFCLWLLLRWIIGHPLAGLQGAMERLSTGDQKVAVPFQEKGDDIGAMARSVQVFKEYLQRVEELQAEQLQAEGTAKAARERLMDELSRHVGDVVEAGAAGDFGHRITAQFDDPTLARLADGINRLVESVDRGLGQVQTVVAGLADADLTCRMSGQSGGAFGALQNNINKMADRLQQLIGEVHSASNTVDGATGELTVGAENLANRTTQQASSLEQTAASVEQLTDLVKRNAVDAQEVAKQVGRFSDLAEKGGEVMATTREAMGRISASSSKISEIIGLIDGIAFQTNLLALNASVEAARAGEAGKGFAVVASEVRRLAQSASEASTEVSRLITDSTKEVEIGNSLVGEVTEHLQQIVDAIQQTRATVGTMAQANQDQSTSLQELATAIRHLDDMTQQNASMAEESRAAVAATRQQVSTLNQIVSGFRVA